jgi:hypothetical protein
LLGRLSESGFELLPASREWFWWKIPTVARETIEDRKVLLNISALKELEARNSLRIECDNLTIENQSSVSKLTHRDGYPAKCGGPVEVVSRQQRHFGAFFVREDADAVVLLLKDPTGPMKRHRHEMRQHGTYADGNAVYHNVSENPALLGHDCKRITAKVSIQGVRLAAAPSFGRQA